MSQRRDAAQPTNDPGLEVESPGQDTNQRTDGLTPSTAPDASFATGAGAGNTGFDSPTTGSLTLSNPEVAKEGQDVADQHQSEPYYPPGGGADNDPQLHDERNG